MGKTKEYTKYYRIKILNRTTRNSDGQVNINEAYIIIIMILNRSISDGQETESSSKSNKGTRDYESLRF